MRVLGKVLSAAVAIVYLVAAAMSGGAIAVVAVAIYLLLPLACIWFSEEMGGYTGLMGRSLITSESPGCFVAAGGWVLLLLPVIVETISYFRDQG